MTPFFDDLEAQLRSAAQAHAGRPVAPRSRRRPAWLRVRSEVVAVAAAVAVVVVIAVGALALLGRAGQQPTSPPPASPPPGAGLAALITKTPQRQLRREFSYIQAATHAVLNSRACQLPQPMSASFIHGAPSRDLLSLLGVLRRPAQPADRLDPALLGGTPDVYAGYVRRALSVDGTAFYIVPARYDRATFVPSERCFSLQAAALAHYLPKIPAALRAPTRALQSDLIAYNRILVARTPRDYVCVVTVGHREGGTSCGTTAAEIRSGFSSGDDNGTFSGLVPDGVASVTLRFPAARGRPARTVTAAVRSNLYAIHVAGRAVPPSEPTVIWRSAVGQVLKTISPPSPQVARKACSRDPECVIARYAITTATSSASATITAPRRAPSAP